MKLSLLKICFTWAWLESRLDFVGKNQKYCPNGGLMMIYHGKKIKNHRKQIRVMKLWYLKLFPFQVSLHPGVTESLGAQHLE